MNDNSMPLSMRLYLPYSAWPEDDRSRWEVAVRTGNDLFDDRGPAARLAQDTRRRLQYGYGKFLFFLSTYDASLLARAPAERLDPNIIEAYVKWQPKTCGGITLANYLHQLRFVLRYMCPSDDWSWLLAITKRILAQAQRKPQKHHLVTSETLYAVGRELMDRAITRSKTTENTSIQQALEYRDGLMIALLALVPLRRRTLTALRIGKHLVRSGNLWSLDIPAADTKTNRPLDYPISPELSGRFDLYLGQFRGRIPGAELHDHLWASSRGRPMADTGIYDSIARRTHRALGIAVNPHRFRHAAATFWSSRDPANVRGAKDLLGQVSFGTTEKHYIMAQSRVAGRALARAIASFVES